MDQEEEEDPSNTIRTHQGHAKEDDVGVSPAAAGGRQPTRAARPPGRVPEERGVWNEDGHGNECKCTRRRSTGKHRDPKRSTCGNPTGAPFEAARARFFAIPVDDRVQMSPPGGPWSPRFASRKESPTSERECVALDRRPSHASPILDDAKDGRGPSNRSRMHARAFVFDFVIPYRWEVDRRPRQDDDPTYARRYGMADPPSAKPDPHGQDVSCLFHPHHATVRSPPGGKDERPQRAVLPMWWVPGRPRVGGSAATPPITKRLHNWESRGAGTAAGLDTTRPDRWNDRVQGVRCSNVTVWRARPPPLPLSL